MELNQLEEILLIISYKDDDSEEAHKAFSNLYLEYSEFMVKLVKKKLNQFGIFDEQILYATVNNTFLIVYENPLSFKIKENETDDNCFKAWLSIVAKNEFLRLLKEYYKTNLILEEDLNEFAFTEVEIDLTLAQSINSKNMQDALNSLSERDREILLMLYSYHETGKKTPTVVLNTICKLFNTTRDNIRQIKKRSEDKIVSFFSKCSPLKPVKNVRY